MARALMREDKILMHIALDDTRIAALKESLAFFAPDVRVVGFPAWDCLPYDRVSPHPDVVAQRVSALVTLLSWEREKERYPRILLTTVNASVQRVTPKCVLEGASLIAKPGIRLERAVLEAFLHNNGYERTQTVRESGEYAVRGGIVDLFPPGYEAPVRIDFFGDEVESIRSFDAGSQRSEGKIKEINLHPATEFFLDEDSITRFRAGYREAFGVIRADDPLYEAVSEGRRYNGMDHWLPLFFEEMASLFDYAPGASVTLDQHGAQSMEERLSQVADFYEARKTLETAAFAKKKKSADVSLSGAIYRPLEPGRLYLGEAEWVARCGDALELSPFASPRRGEADAQRAAGEGYKDSTANVIGPSPNPLPTGERAYREGCGRKGRDFADIRALPDGDVFRELHKHMTEIRRSGNPESRKILIAAYSAGSRERLKGLMAGAGIGGFKECEGWEHCKKLDPGDTGLAVLSIEHGFVAPDLAVITEQDILGDRLARRQKKRKKAENFLKEVSSLNEGDLVVHLEHGVGRFLGLETLKAAGTLHDCLKLEYAGGDRLFIPVENIDTLSRFGSSEGIVQLDKLGGAGWQARKAKVKKDLMIIAGKLLEVAAARKLKKADRLEVEKSVYNEFAARFPYQETEDQERAIDAALEDLSSEQPMDRLVCGDVGFGKTEVALRAAYVAAMNGTQVAVVVPTTLLARQHYQNFAARFKGTGLRVAQLSRMVTNKDADLTRGELKDGTVNIVVGTHAILGKNVKFANLGLVVVDEEQRFGVKQKEKLKELRANVHVLTLTATPIPRTLQMALTGARDMSIIATPPVDRLAIRTFVLPFDPMVVREALLREHYRGGQSFYVCPRIKDLQEVEENIRELVPEVKIVTAHGQMAASDLEDRMTAFYDGQYDVLIATNIIESGIDIPTANTMIVHNSDLFGLAQLYQIRGRIGRSKVRAYAYLTHDPYKKLTDQAQKRLEVIETLDTLGAGFQLASHDMDIRGAGNLLGEEQSGHIREVGVELYQQMLEEAVAAAREGFTGEEAPTQDHYSPTINIGMSVLIPERYVADLNVRMSLYRRITDLREHDDIESFAAELIDRFGPLPDEVENLLQIVEIKQLCLKCSIDRVDAGPKGAVIGFFRDSPPNPDKLLQWMVQKGGAIKLRPDQKIVAIRQWDRVSQRVKGVRSLLKEIAGI
ncbi:MAG: transcription-repair coupling factor [Alphaproteobacteria bacterium]|nr:transcription-repair coupling factor [Alphaproteobacteria bacterium]